MCINNTSDNIAVSYAINNNISLYKLFDKRDTFPFTVVWMPHIDSNFSRTIFYSTIKSEVLRIACSTLFLDDFIPKHKEIINRVESHGSKFIPTKHALQNFFFTSVSDVFYILWILVVTIINNWIIFLSLSLSLFTHHNYNYIVFSIYHNYNIL